MSMVRRMRICDISQDEAAMSTRLKIAFATSDMQHVNQHFGSARTFAVYAVDMESSELLEAAQFGELAQDGNEDKLSVKIDLLDGCAAVYCEAVGASAIRQIMAAGIQPVKVNRDSLIADLIEDFQNELKTGPSAWLAKAIARQNGADPSRFARMEAEGWEE
ncbi:nitrogen fixation protein NifX [Methylogaea oryzae]|uniref:Nitrogen fixation protein NifX n=1 Tax=Methylogaea oryzae TaxID=1295382 RepID=A0A8D5AJ56_9GAMM|nr:nitrogen fixation protein NifX [Methylogaea oryzae]BBL72056.1 nitrogen fixation protein NifX [Methylogaea oryzae]